MKSQHSGLLIFSLAAACQGNPICSGVYQLSDLVAESVSSPDTSLFLEFYTVCGSDTLQFETTQPEEYSGSSVAWDGSYAVYLYDNQEETTELVFILRGSDTLNTDYLDSGEAGLWDLVTNGSNTVCCEHGAVISFEIHWLGLD